MSRYFYLITEEFENFYIFSLSCADGDNDILFLFNEKPLQIPGCDSNGVCKQSLILERFSRYLNVWKSTVPTIRNKSNMEHGT